MVNKYLFLAFSFVWMVFVVYAWNLSRRQGRLRKDIEDLKRAIRGQPRSDG